MNENSLFYYTFIVNRTAVWSDWCHKAEKKLSKNDQLTE